MDNETMNGDHLRDLPIKYVPDFALLINSLKERAVLRSIDGHARWIVTELDGSLWIYRPIEANE